MSSRVLTLNAGSSSVKFALYEMGGVEERQAAGILDRIGLADGHFRATNGAGVGLVERLLDLPNHAAALKALMTWLGDLQNGSAVQAVGHRIVQGGPRLTEPCLVNPAIRAELASHSWLAPAHMPGQIAAIDAVSAAMPGVPQVLCFDTAFHRTMPEIVQRLPLPREYFDRGVRRYGFHGLSYQYVVGELRRIDGPRAEGRLVIAHLGNGASLAAVRGGLGVDTTMGLTPLGGLMMGSRSGDLDPSVVLHLLREQRLTVDQADDLLNKRSGMLGVSGVSSDMKDLLDRENSNPHAAEAIEMFCRSVRKFVATMAASLGGIDVLIFTGGIGEHAAPIRERIVGGLGFLGLAIDAAANTAGAEVISSADSRVVVRVVKTNEELVIARETTALLDSPPLPR